MSTSEKKFVIKHVFKDISSVDDEFGDEETHYNIKWMPCVSKKKGYVHFSLYCFPVDADRDYSVKVDLELRVTSGDKSIVVVQREYTFTDDEFELDSIASFRHTEIERKLTDDSLTVEIHVKILETSGIKGMKSRYDESMAKCSDVVLVVDGEKFYVSKTFLASRSLYFLSLFMGNFKESTQSEVVLNGIEVEDLQNFLDILYLETTFTDETVDTVLRLADMYDTKCVFKHAEQFLMEKSKKSAKEKVALAVKYNLQNIKKWALSHCPCARHMKEYLPDDLTELDHAFMVELLKNLKTSNVCCDNTVSK